MAATRVDAKQVSSMPQPFIPHPLHDKTKIHENIISTNHNLPVSLMRKECSKQIAQVAQTPLHEEEDGQPGGALDVVVLVDLGQLCE